MIHVYRSNRLEKLADALAEVLSEPLASPFDPECIVVQSRGMETWISMALAERFGVWANAEYPFPRAFIEQAIASAGALEVDGLTWAIMAYVASPEHLARRELANIADYLADDPRGLKRHELARRIASVFDQYAVYRADLVNAWAAGKDDHWQAVLWRAVVEERGTPHVAKAAARFFEAVRGGGASQLARPELPRRVSLFGVSTLPPLYLEIVSALSELIEVHLFQLSPSLEFWADIRSDREISRTLRKTKSTGGGDLHLDEGHPLLASLGRLGRDFQQVLESRCTYDEPAPELHVDPGTRTLLARIQSDILRLRRPTRARLEPEDRSIAVHSCHGPMREVEVLHDQLLAAFEEDPTLEARDVAVLTPDVDAYAPLIEAVFGAGGAHLPVIPQKISDRSVRSASPVADAFLALLDLAGGRAKATEILDLIAMDPVRERFGLDASEVELAQAWLRQAGVRWGIDADHRSALGQPAFAENTWRFGLDRLLLGYAMPGSGRAMFRGVLPFDEIEGQTAEVLGRAAELLDVLFSDLTSLSRPRPAGEWRDALTSSLERMIASDEDNAHEHQVIREALADLAAKAEAAGFAEPVAIEIIARELAERLEGARTTAGFLSGGVTFCAMLPMRSIPFRVMALLGMSDRDFPRASRRLGFDLIAAEPRTGDRSTRDDDRYLFLEALLSARERLIVTFTGQSIRDNTDLPPSVVVSELLDTIAEAAGLRQEEVRRRLVVRHPLQPFSPRYFGSSVDARLFSFASGYRDGARAVRGGRDGLAPFVASPLADDDRPGAITLDDLQRFYRLPAKFLLNRRLGIHLREESETSDDREPIKLDPLERYHVGTALLEWGLDAWSASGDTGPPPPAKVARWLESALPALRARGILPLGTPGQCLFEDLSADVGALLSLVVQETAGTRAAPLAVDLALGGVQLAGWLDRVWPRAQVRFGYSKVQPKYELEVWIRHVALCAMNAPGYPRRSVLIGRAANPNHPPSKVAFEPVENAAEVMSDLVGLYAAGRTRPLPFFPGASMAYARACLGGAPHDQALRAARQEFIKNIPGGYGGDGKEPEVERVFGDRDPLELAEFAEVACRVLSPLIAHRVEQD